MHQVADGVAMAEVAKKNHEANESVANSTAKEEEVTRTAAKHQDRSMMTDGKPNVKEAKTTSTKAEPMTLVAPLPGSPYPVPEEQSAPSAVVADAVGSSASTTEAVAAALPVSSPSQISSRSLHRLSVPCATPSASTSFTGGVAGMTTAPLPHQPQSDAVYDSIVRSSSALLAPELAVSTSSLGAIRALRTPSPASLTAGESSSHPTPSLTVASTEAEPVGESVAARPHALEVLHRAVNHVRTNLHRGITTAAHSVHATEEERTGHRIAQTLKAVMRAAETIDVEDTESRSEESGGDDSQSEATTATRRSHRTLDWRDDTDTIVSPSTFFHSGSTLQVRSNRVMEYIVAKGHAAQTSEELTWLYRHALLTSLLDVEDLKQLVPRALHREYTSGELILNADAPVQHLYVIVWGDVDVFRVDSINHERKAMEGAFRVFSHQSVTAKLRSLSSRGPGGSGGGRRTSLVAYGLDPAESEEYATPVAASENTYTHVASLCPGQVFGMENCVFNANSRYVFRAGSAATKTVLSLLPYEELQPVLARNPRFAQGVGVCITGSIDVFGPIREFCRNVFSPTTAQNEYLPLWSILESYTRIHNVIHTKLFSRQVDTGAWGYALNRLPDNLTSTFCFDLVHALPPFVASRMRVEARAADTRKITDSSASGRNMRTAITFIRTKERRRCTWHLGMEGKTLVLLRDGFTDLLDFLTMLCVHIIESNKLRGRVQGMVHPPAIDILDEYLRQREHEELNGIYLAADGVTREKEMQRIETILQRMPLTEEEQRGLVRNWGHNTLLRIYEIMMHREEYNVRIDLSLSMRFQTNPFHEWALNLRGCVLEKLGLDRFSALPDNLYIDVVSSNTHCIKNLLCSFHRKYRTEILDYARRKEGKRLGRPEDWHNVDDMLYAALTGFLQNERPDLREEYNRSLEQNGITVLKDTAMTGLQVDVIPVHLLNFNTIDDTIRDSLQVCYEELVKQDNPNEASQPRASRLPSWAQVCKPIWRRSSDGTRTRVTGCVMSNSAGDVASGAGVRSPLPNSAAEPDTTDLASSTSASDRKGLLADPSIDSAAASSTKRHGTYGRLQRHFIINMDFAFGAQAEGICRVIFSAFGKRIRSVNVMGKAGGLMGKRGDIQLASHVLLSKSSLILEDNQDELRNCRNQDLTVQRLQELAGPRVNVHHGKVLTVTGTMLQNAHLLRYYQQVWRCVGTEMEGSYFARVIEDFYRQGIAHPGLTSRFAYYTSDLPLAQNDAEMEMRRTHRLPTGAATLSAPMSPQEGVPPLYAIARGILENILL